MIDCKILKTPGAGGVKGEENRARPAIAISDVYLALLTIVFLAHLIPLPIPVLPLLHRRLQLRPNSLNNNIHELPHRHNIPPTLIERQRPYILILVQTRRRIRPRRKSQDDLARRHIFDHVVHI